MKFVDLIIEVLGSVKVVVRRELFAEELEAKKFVKIRSNPRMRDQKFESFVYDMLPYSRRCRLICFHVTKNGHFSRLIGFDTSDRNEE